MRGWEPAREESLTRKHCPLDLLLRLRDDVGCGVRGGRSVDAETRVREQRMIIVAIEVIIETVILNRGGSVKHGGEDLRGPIN